MLGKPDITYVGTDKIVNKHLECYGAAVKQINYYKMQTGSKIRYLAMYLTADNRIADMQAY